MVKRDKYEEHMERMLSALGDLHQKIDSQNQKIDIQNQKIDFQSQQIQELVQENKELKLTIAQQARIISQQALEISQLKSRVDTIEERLAAIDEHLGTIAPLVRDLLADEESILLDPEYKDIRDSENQSSFNSAHEVLKQTDRYDTLLANYKNAHGAASSFGKRLKDFYVQVLGYSPRIVGQKSIYWPEPELVLTDCVIDSFEKIMLN